MRSCTAAMTAHSTTTAHYAQHHHSDPFLKTEVRTEGANSRKVYLASVDNRWHICISQSHPTCANVLTFCEEKVGVFDDNNAHCWMQLHPLCIVTWWAWLGKIEQSSWSKFWPRVSLDRRLPRREGSSTNVFGIHVIINFHSDIQS